MRLVFMSIVALVTLFSNEAYAQIPFASPTISPSPTSSPTETPEAEFCSLDTVTTVEATLEMIDVVAMTQRADTDDPQRSGAKRVVRPAGVSIKAPPLEVTLARQCCTNGCTTGTLTMPGFECKTLELPNLGNKTDISCIPPGRYVCVRVNSPKFGDTFEITEVDGRYNVVLHSGNSKKHTKGCVLLGMQVNDAHNFISRSKEAMQRFLDQLRGVRSFVLIVKEDFPKKPPPPAPTIARR